MTALGCVRIEHTHYNVLDVANNGIELCICS